MQSTDRPNDFDAFISYNRADQQFAEQLVKALTERGLRIWLDDWCLRPGSDWQRELALALQKSPVCIVLIGSSGFGPWHRREVQLALVDSDSGKRIIPALLPGAARSFDSLHFLALMTWVDLQRGIEDVEAMDRLVWGITGTAPRLFSPGDAPTAGKPPFSITSPSNGDVSVGPCLAKGIGPPRTQFTLCIESTEEHRGGLRLHISGIKTNSKGLWQCHIFETPDPSLRPGLYNMFVEDKDFQISCQPIA